MAKTNTKKRGRHNSTDGYKKGRDRNQEILKEAANLLINGGYSNFSMRKVAKASGITVGNLQHYYPTKEKLVQAMLDDVLQPYQDTWGVIRNTDRDPREYLIDIIQQITRDIKTKKTTKFFPELWSLANHEREMNKYMDAMYGKYRAVLAEIILQINPKLSLKQAKLMALFISASLEGHTMFIGYQKPWIREAENIIKVASQCFLWMIDKGHIPD